jgi:hypothetical protein
MQNKLFYDILDKKRINILPLFKHFKKDFYLAGGTSLALQIGHRDSIDFDFFTQNSFSTPKLFEKILKIFAEYEIQKIQEEKDTLTVLLDSKIKLSFFAYQYKLIDQLIDADNFYLASINDIGCMKFSAIIGRSTLKDYVDLYFILQEIKLITLLKLAIRKFHNIDENLILKSLVYFDDLEIEPIKFKHNKKISLEKIKTFLNKEVKKII